MKRDDNPTEVAEIAGKLTLSELIADLADNLSSVDPDAEYFLVDQTWAKALIATVPTDVDVVIVKATGFARLRTLAATANVIATVGENRFINGVYVPMASEVMHEMASVIRHSLTED